MKTKMNTHLDSAFRSPHLHASMVCVCVFQVYIAKVDPTASLGLSTDSIYSYNMGHIKRVLGGEAPESQPSRCMSRGPTSITVALKGPWGHGHIFLFTLFFIFYARELIVFLPFPKP